MQQEANSGTRHFLLMVLFASWLAAFGFSTTFIFAEPAGDGFTRGMNGLTGFLGWQGIAGMLSFTLWAAGRALPKGSGMRRITRIPISITLLLIGAMVGLVVWVRLFAG